jgi:hypothetical protein
MSLETCLSSQPTTTLRNAKRFKKDHLNTSSKNKKIEANNKD